MTKRPVRALLVATAAGTAFMLSATAALAATLTVTVAGANSNGAVSAASGTVTLKDTRNGDTVTCTSSTVTGTVKDEKTTGTAPVKVGTIDNTTFTSCTWIAGATLTITQKGTWNLVMTQATNGGVTAGGVTNVRFTWSATACAATMTGSMAGTFTNPSGSKKPVLMLSPSAPNPEKFALKIASANCLGILKAGDGFQVTAGYTVTNPAKLAVNAH
jgi:hypothetical protein